MSTASPNTKFKTKVDTCIVPEISATEATHVAKASHIDETGVKSGLCVSLSNLLLEH